MEPIVLAIPTHLTYNNCMSNSPETYIYESPDGGDTIYRRKSGETDRELVHQGPLQKRLMKEKLWTDIHRASEQDLGLKEMLNQIEIYYHLKNSP